jgi:hypothetical protein
MAVPTRSAATPTPRRRRAVCSWTRRRTIQAVQRFSKSTSRATSGAARDAGSIGNCVSVSLLTMGHLLHRSIAARTGSVVFNWRQCGEIVRTFNSAEVFSSPHAIVKGKQTRRKPGWIMNSPSSRSRPISIQVAVSALLDSPVATVQPYRFIEMSQRPKISEPHAFDA